MNEVDGFNLAFCANNQGSLKILSTKKIGLKKTKKEQIGRGEEKWESGGYLNITINQAFYIKIALFGGNIYKWLHLTTLVKIVENKWVFAWNWKSVGVVYLGEKQLRASNSCNA